MAWDLKSVGLVLFGVAALIFSLVVLHFYVTRVVPETEKPVGISSYCEVRNGVPFVHITTFTTGGAEDVNVYVAGKLVCTFKDIPPASSEVCKGEKLEAPEPYRIEYVQAGERRVSSGVCVSLEAVKPVD